MKKCLLIALACAALASCAKDEANAPNVNQTSDAKITFETPAINKNTRAELGVVESTTYDKNEEFKVWGLWFENGSYDKFSNGVQYMWGSSGDGIEVAYDNTVPDGTTKGSWVSQNNYYWPKTGSITFQAYSPATASGTATCTANGIQITDFVNPAVGAQYDLMYSERSYDKKESTGGTTYDGVDINFKHALTAVRVVVKTEDTYDDNTITVNSIKFSNVEDKGTFNQGLTDGPNSVTTSSNSLWSNLTGTATYDAVKTEFEANQTGATSDTNGSENLYDIIMIPQAYPDFEIKYSIQPTTGNAVTVTNTSTLASIFQGTAFEIGKLYTLTITIKLDKIYFSPEVTNWDSTTTGAVSI